MILNVARHEEHLQIESALAELRSEFMTHDVRRIQPYRPDWTHSKGDLAAYLPTFFGVKALIEPAGPAIALLRIAARHPRIIRENLKSAA